MLPVPSGKARRPTRWGRCVLCSRALRPTVAWDGLPVLLCSKYEPGHTRRIVARDSAEFESLPPVMVRRVRVLM